MCRSQGGGKGDEGEEGEDEEGCGRWPELYRTEEFRQLKTLMRESSLEVKSH